MMILVSVVVLCVILFIASCAAAFFEAPRYVGDVYCFFGYACCMRGSCIGFRSERIFGNVPQ